MRNLNSFEKTLEFLQQSNRVFIAAHIMPDGDCIGSALGLTWALRKLGKTVTVTCHDHVSTSFDFLPGFAELTPKLPQEEDLLVYVDGSSADRFGPAFDPALFDGRQVIAIDHHITNEFFAPVNLIDPHAASTAEIIYRLVTALPVTIDPVIAQCLLTGVITDTLGFRTVSTNVETLQTATALMQAGGTIPEIIDNAFNRVPLANLKLQGRILSEAQPDGIVLLAQVPLKLIREMGVSNNGTGGLVNQLLSVEGTRIAALLTEKENGKIEVGLRSRVGYDVAAIAQKLGGGGHRQAAGALIDGPLPAARERVIEAIKQSIR